MKVLDTIQIEIATKTGRLPVMEHFYTLQGEGAWAGTPAYFIRLAGCDVGCHWCDVKESWSLSEEQYLDELELLEMVVQSGALRVVITGGEPTLHDLTSFCDLLHKKGLYIHMETAGVYPLRGDIDWICFSPKKFKAPLSLYYEQAHELKVIVYNLHDLEWAEEHAARCHEGVQRFLQPEWSRIDKVQGPLVEYIKSRPYWRMSLQTHKYLDIR